MSNLNSPLYCTPYDAVSRWGCSRSYLYQLLAAGKIGAKKLGNRLTLIDVVSGDAFFASLPNAKINPQRKSKTSSPAEAR
jgi:hypothetical protein